MDQSFGPGPEAPKPTCKQFPGHFVSASIVGVLQDESGPDRIGIVLDAGPSDRRHFLVSQHDIEFLNSVLNERQDADFEGTNSQSDKSSGKSRSAGQSPLDGMNVLPPTSSIKAICGDR